MSEREINRYYEPLTRAIRDFVREEIKRATWPPIMGEDRREELLATLDREVQELDLKYVQREMEEE